VFADLIHLLASSCNGMILCLIYCDGSSPEQDKYKHRINSPLLLNIGCYICCNKPLCPETFVTARVCSADFFSSINEYSFQNVSHVLDLFISYFDNWSIFNSCSGKVITRQWCGLMPLLQGSLQHIPGTEGGREAGGSLSLRWETNRCLNAWSSIIVPGHSVGWTLAFEITVGEGR
jgi:hypothetical protein